MLKKQAPQITFETESDLRETCRQLLSNLITMAGSESALRPYLSTLAEMSTFLDEVYKKNVKLLENVQEMNAHIVVNATKVQMIRASTQKDVSSLSKLKEEYEEASNMVKFTHESEQRSKQILKSLRNTIQNLSDRIAQSEAFSFGQDTSLFDLNSEVQNLVTETQKGKTEIEEMKAKIEHAKTSYEYMKEFLVKCEEEEVKMRKGIEENDKLLEEIVPLKEETSCTLKDMTPAIQEQKAILKDIKKRKAEIIEGNDAIKKSHYTSLSGLSAIRDQRKHHRNKSAQKMRQLIELQRISANRESRIEIAKEKIVDCESEIKHLRKELESVQKQIAESDVENKALESQLEKIGETKQQVRKQLKDMRPQYVNLEFQLTQTENAKVLKARTIMASRLQINEQQQSNDQAKKDTIDAVNAVATLKRETKHQKKIMEGLKDKVIGMYSEIDKIRMEKMHLTANSEMMREKVEISREENEMHMKELENMKKKNEHQCVLADQLRDERNESKRKLESLEKENEELKSQNEEQALIVSGLQEKFEKMLQKTVLGHYDIRRLKESIALMTENNKECEKGIQAAERITSRLQAECQTLNHILREATHDSLQQQQEFEKVRNNQFAVQNQLYEKEHQAQDLRGEIQTQEAHLRKCSDSYNKKCKEIATLTDRLKDMQKVTDELEQKCKIVEQMKSEIQRLVTDGMIENHKYRTLIHEFSVVRNVHRWDVLEAVEPGYVKNIKFRNSIYAKINSAHNELVALQEERDTLKKQFEKMQEQHSQSISAADAMNDIQKYKDDLKRMNTEIKEMQNEIARNKALMAQGNDRVSAMRGRMTMRREETSVLKTTINTLRHSLEAEDADGGAWFMTEIGAGRPDFIGGGFNKTLTQRQGIIQEPEVIGEPRPMAPKKRRPGSTSLSSPVFRPREMQVYYGKATFLPPML